MSGARFARAHAHYDDDLGHWLRVARRTGGPVLDLGCASGRVAVPLARAGLEVLGVDRDPGMLEEAERAASAAGEDVAGRLRTIDADMRDFRLSEPVALAIAPMNSLQLLTEPEDRVACLRAVHAALRPRGELHFDVALPDLADIAASLGVVRQIAAWQDDEGSVVHWASFDDLDTVTQTVALRTVVDLTGADGRLEREITTTDLHLYLPCELELLLAATGFEVLSIAGGFAGEPLDMGAERQVYACRREGAS